MHTVTPSRLHTDFNSLSFSSGTDSTILSWLSDIHISQGCIPACFSSTPSRSTSAPVDWPISPTAELKPPAPQSVMHVYNPLSRASRIASAIFFSSIGFPICTALPGEVSSSIAEEKVAPCSPSRPVRPPIKTILSAGLAFLDSIPLGIIPPVPQNTSGAPRKSS